MIKVFVYFNLHKRVWSVKAMEGPQRGRVIAHATKVYLKGVVFEVSESGRQRVIAQQQKNVHAGVVGFLWRYEGEPTEAGREVLRDGHALWEIEDLYHVPTMADKGVDVTYNPYAAATFVTREERKPIHWAQEALINEAGVRVIK